MKPTRILIAVVLLLLGTQPIMAETGDIQLDHAWARPTLGAGMTSGAYLTLTATGQADRLVAVSTPVAKTAELHQSLDDHGVMKMRPLDGLPLDPGKPVTLKPGGYHVMLMGLHQPLKPGDTFPLTLTFEHAPPLTATVTVEAAGGRPATRN